MLRNLILAVGLVALVLGGTLLMCNPASADPFLIVPGKSIGKLTLTHRGTAALRRLGKPDVVDAGMSQTRQVWVTRNSSHDTLYVHTTANGALDVRPSNDITLDEIRVTSARFHTREGIRTGVTLAQVRRRYPGLHRDGDTTPTAIYTDDRRGIGFEFEGQSPTARCIAITVYPPGSGHPTSRAMVNYLLRDNTPTTTR